MATGEVFEGYTKYQSDAGGIYSIRLSGDVSDIATNTSPAGAFTDARVKVSVSNHGRKRISGIKARGLVLGLPITTGAAKDSSRTFAAIRTLTAYTAFGIGSNVTYQGGTWVVRDKVGEA